VGFRQSEHVKNDVVVCDTDGRRSYAAIGISLTTWSNGRHRIEPDHNQSNRRRDR